MKLLRTLRLAAVAIAALPLVLVHAEAPAVPKSATFIRSAERSDHTTAAETLSAEYVPADGNGPSVWLIGVAHLGTPEYYQAIQARLDRQSVVLYEGIGVADSVKKGPGHGSHEMGIQPSLAKALGLVFQLDAVDYRSPRFINSDMKVDTIETRLKARSQGEKDALGDSADAGAPTDQTFAMMMDALRGEGVVGTMLNGFVGALGKSAEMQELTKTILVEALGSAGELIDMAQAASPGFRDLFKIILTDRNAIVVADLRERMKALKTGDTIAIFYGAAHMDGIAAQLQQELALIPARTEWDTAFTANPAKAGMSQIEIKLMIEMAKMQLKAMKTPAAKQAPVAQ